MPITRTTVKQTKKITKTIVPRARLSRKLRFLNQNEPLFPTRGNEGLIEWPTKRQLRAVSARLVRISRMGIRSELKGDYFYSGDLAYQIHEIIHATAHLFEKSQRPKR
jgi:hypothetical protein